MHRAGRAPGRAGLDVLPALLVGRGRFLSPDYPGMGEPVVVDDQLGKIMDEIWDNRHQYDPCKPVRGRLIAKSGNTMRVDIPTQLASLDELLAKGVIDEEEFSIAKAKVLNLPTNVP